MKIYDLVIKSGASGNHIKPMTGGYLDNPVVCTTPQDIKSVTVGDVVYRYVGSSYAPNEKPYLDWIEARRESANGKTAREYKDIAKYAMGALHALLQASKGAGIVPAWDQANVAYYNCKERLERLAEAVKED